MSTDPSSHLLRSFDLPLSRPLATAAGDIGRRRGFLLGLVGDGGAGGDDGGVVGADVVGVGEATPLPGWTESLADCEAALRDVLARTADGDIPDPADPALTDRPAAHHAVESAVRDAHARSEDASLATHLARDGPFDADPAQTVSVNATVGDDDADATVDAAQTAVAEGFETVKLKIGARSLDADLARVAAVRDAFPSVSLRVDANGAWDRETAARALDELAAFDVAAVEQPVPAAELDALSSLAGGDGPAVAADEALTVHDVLDVVAAADVVVCKPMALGGPATALAVAGEARTAGVDAYVTTTVDGAVARATAVAVAAAVPDVRACGLATGAMLDADVAPDPVPVRDGAVAVPAGPGIGADVVRTVFGD